MFAPLISVIAGIFSTLFSLIRGWFGWFLAGLASKSVFVTLQLSVTVILVASHIVLMGFFLYAIMFVFNKYNEYLGLIRDMSNGSEVLTIAFQVIQSFGIINAFNDVFSIFSPFIIAYLVYRAGLIVYHSWVATSTEIFKLGVLVQQ